MRVFVTGSTGFVGTAVVNELLSAGHTVVGLTRSDQGVAQLEGLHKGTGAVEALRGTIEDLDLLQRTAAASDAVLHLAFHHDFSKFAEACAMDRAAIAALAAGLEGTGKPLVVTTGCGLLTAGIMGTEDDGPDAAHPWSVLRGQSETLTLGLAADKGVRAMVIRLAPTTHGPGTSGFMSILVGTALRKGTAAYVGDGRNAWCACHRDDAARLYRLAMEKGRAGAVYHAVAEEAVALKDLTDAIGGQLGLPVVSISPDEVPAHFGWFALAGTDHRASSVKTRQELGWNPAGPTVVEDAGVIVDYVKTHGSPV
ncbi:oxidoreductase [Apiospora kogelbergensis]|uniref:Oxidoreductase n=1 Tax=Apiospora kogelbergensis TaxID=1337665 RepID=A0AAW0QC22_9PEZI